MKGQSPFSFNLFHLRCSSYFEKTNSARGYIDVYRQCIFFLFALDIREILVESFEFFN